MVTYVSIQIDSAQLGGRTLCVKCDKCDCEYFYELTRIGKGTGSAPYGLFQGLAKQKADSRAERNLANRLTTEGELVPCPKCHWISDSLIQGYRRVRFRGLTSAAIAAGVGGTLISLICAWFLSLGPMADQGATPYFLFGGPILSMLLAVGFLLTQRFLRNRIQPNQNFPGPPSSLPIGTPLALLRVPNTDEWIAVEREENGKAIDEWHVFTIGRQTLPNVCCRCVTPISDDETKPSPYVDHGLEIPQCMRCTRAIRWKRRAIWFASWSMLLVSIAVFLKMIGFRQEEFWVLLVGGGMIAMAIAARITWVATQVVKFKRGDDERGIVNMKFHNYEFDQLVKEHLKN